MIIDIHTHAFPDAIAVKSMGKLEESSDVKAFHDGRLSSLLKSMDNACIDKAIICSIATKPSQFFPILEWSKKIASDRIIPFCSVHPMDEDIKEKIKILFNEGIKGIKLHPYYQGFKLDDEKAYPIYEEIVNYDLALISHTGFDMAFEKKRIADPDAILNLINKFPGLKFIATHFGSWFDWEEVGKKLIGKKIFIEISFSLNYLDKDVAKNFFANHPEEYLLFGTDSPWTDQSESLKLLYSYNLKKEHLEKILSKNTVKLLKL